MSASATVLKACPNLQGSLDENYMNCHTVREPLPFLEFLLSPTNRQPIVDMVSMGGKIRTIELLYKQRELESSVDSNVANPTCTGGSKRTEFSKTYTIDPNQNLHWDGKIDLMDPVYSCREDIDRMIAEYIQAGIDAIMKKMATNVAVEAVALKGGWASDVTGLNGDNLEVRTTKSGDTSTLYPYTQQEIQTAVLKSGYCVNWAVFGGQTLYNYMKNVQFSGCCATSGIDLRSQFDAFGFASVWDRRVKSALGSEDKNLLVASGALQLLNWNLYKGAGTTGHVGMNYWAGVVTDPATGFPFDIMIKDDCGAISINLFATHKLVGLPTDMFADTDVYDGITGVAEIDVVNS